MAQGDDNRCLNQDMDNPGVCDLCQEDFDEGSRCPRILPCSHHFCTYCIKTLIEKSMKQCPMCRKNFRASSVNDFMINRGILSFIDYVNNREGPHSPSTSTVNHSKEANSKEKPEEKVQTESDIQSRNSSNSNNTSNEGSLRDTCTRNDNRQNSLDEFHDATESFTLEDTNDGVDHDSAESLDEEQGEHGSESWDEEVDDPNDGVDHDRVASLDEEQGEHGSESWDEEVDDPDEYLDDDNWGQGDDEHEERMIDMDDGDGYHVNDGYDVWDNHVNAYDAWSEENEPDEGIWGNDAEEYYDEEGNDQGTDWDQANNDDSVHLWNEDFIDDDDFEQQYDDGVELSEF